MHKYAFQLYALHGNALTGASSATIFRFIRVQPLVIKT